MLYRGPLDFPESENGEYPRQRLFVFLILIAAFLLRMFRLSGQSIWVDEMLTLSSSGITTPLHLIDIFDNLHGPLHSIVIFLWSRLAGQSEFALRFPSVVFSILSMFVIYRLILRLTGSGTALIALGLMAFSPFHVWYAQEARNYSMFLFFAALSFQKFFDLLYEPDRKNFVLYLAVTLAAFLSNMSAAFVALVQDVFFFFSHRKLSLRTLVMAHVFLALLLSPWLVGMFQRIEFHRLARTEPYAETEFLRGETTFSVFALPYTFFVFSEGYSLGPSLSELHGRAGLAAVSGYSSVLVPAAIGFSLALVLGIVSLRRRRALLLLLGVWILIPLAVVSFFAVKNFKPFNPRYVMMCYPAYLILVAEGLRPGRGALKGPMLKVSLIRFAASALVLVTVLASLWNYYQAGKYGKDDFRSAAEILSIEFAPGDVVFTEGTSEPLIYYVRHNREPIVPVPIYNYMIRNEDALAGFITKKTQQASRVWLVTSRLWDIDPDGKVPALFRCTFIAEKSFHTRGVDLALFAARRAGPSEHF